MTPEREAELRGWALGDDDDVMNCSDLLEALDAMAEERSRAERAEGSLRGLGLDSGIEFEAELKHLRGEGPDPRRGRHLAEVTAYLARMSNSGFDAARILVELQVWLEREAR